MTKYEIYCALRDEKGVKDKNVADALGITRSTFSDWKSGRSEPKADKMIRIAEYFGVSYSYLMGLTTDKTTPRSKFDINATVDLITDNVMDQMEKDIAEGKIDIAAEIAFLIQDDTYIDVCKTPDQIKKAFRLFALYQKLDPSAQKAFETLLKKAQSDV